MNSNLYIGVMSGTSLDGIDIALCEITSSECQLLAFEEYSFDAKLKKEILEIISGVTTLKQIGELDVKLGLAYAFVLKRFLREKKIEPENVVAVGLHGQTLWHEPDGDFPFSMQLGSASVVSAQTGMRVVNDFRNMDIANGGQGAPFAPAFHQFLFDKLGKNIGVLNLGGIANLSVLGDKLLGYDIGPANILMDLWINKTQQKSYDKDGEFAKSGKIDEALLESMLRDDYFKKSPPKSTGREYFNESWLASLLPIFNTMQDEDLQRTLLELTAKSIANELKKQHIKTLILCGGGAKNGFLVERLTALTQAEVKQSDEYGVRSDAMEAMAFAWLAKKRVNGEIVALSSVTGATKNSLLGGIYG
jgi:anhydro-N-acetylmuramic acid kinase